MRAIFRAAGFCLLLLFVVVSLQSFEVRSLLQETGRLFGEPLRLLFMTAVYGTAFLLRAYAWRWYLRGRITIREGLYGLLYSLLVNHISPFKVGDAVRAAVVAKKGRVPLADAAQSVIVLRLLDLLALAVFGAAGTLLIWGEVYWGPILFAAGVFGVVTTVILWRSMPRFLQKQTQLLREALQGWRGIGIAVFVAASWVCEAYVIYSVAAQIDFIQAVWVNSVTIAGQVFQLTPGGIGTYEAVMTFALQAVGAKEGNAYEWSLISHGFKFFFSYAAGAAVMILYPMQLMSFLRKKQKGEDLLWRK